MMLDLQAVRTFVLVVEYGNMTRAAEAAGTAQPVVSQRIKTLEAALGQKLLDRTSRFVRLTNEGAEFLPKARHLLAAHDAALATGTPQGAFVSLAMSDHTLGVSFDVVLGQLKAALPTQTCLDLRLGQSLAVRELFDRGEVDLAVIRREGKTGDGEVLGEDPVQWWSAPGHTRGNGALPLALLPEPCGVRASAIKALEGGTIAWRVAFEAGSCLALTAAVRAGLGVAPLGRIVGSQIPGCVVLDDLPEPRPSQIVLLARTHSILLISAAQALSASVREMLRRSAMVPSRSAS
jgi:DNA-binding transcriptional LysR family regulator